MSGRGINVQRWGYIRLAILLAIAFGVYTTVSKSFIIQQPLDWRSPIVGFVGTFVLVLAVLAAIASRSGPNQYWTKPCWNSSPFGASGPLVLWQFVSIFLAGCGLGALFTVPRLGLSAAMYGLWLLAGSCGIVTATQAFLRLFRKRITIGP